MPLNFYNNFFVNPTLPDQLEEERAHIVTFRKYMAIMFVAFSIGLILEFTFDFKQFEWWTFAFVQLISVTFLILSALNFKHRLLIILNFIMILASNQLSLVLNPKSFHVLVFWLGVMPVFLSILTNARDTIIYSILIGIFTITNGIYIQKEIGPYDLTLFPDRFILGGVIFLATTSVMAVFYSRTQAKIRERLYKQNFELSALSEEVEKQNVKLKDYNEHLEERVHNRTQELELQNKQLAEYAHINSHLLRGPLARVLGIIDLLERTDSTPEQKQYLEHLLKASKDLDEVVTKINLALEQEGKVSREAIEKLKD